MLDMASEDELVHLGKATGMRSGANRVLEVRLDDILDVERSLGMIQMMTEEAANLFSKLDLSQSSYSSSNSEAVLALAAKQDDVKVRSGFVLLKIRDMIFKGTTEDVTSLNLAQPSPLDISPRTKMEDLVLASEGGNSTTTTVEVPPFVIQSPFARGDKLPLKYIKTGDNTKAAFQKPSTIYAPTAVKAQLSIDTKEFLVPSLSILDTGMMSQSSPSVCKSPKKRTRRDRTRSKGPVMPEPVIQRLLPGDTSKIPEDGYLWRKYGNKSIKTASFKRGYYKCRHYKELQCDALKRVQQIEGDQTAFSIYYIREHTCRQLSGNNNLGGAVPGSGTHLGGGGQEGAIPLSFDQFRKDMDEDEIDWPSREDDKSDEPFRHSEDATGNVDSSTRSAAPLFEMPSTHPPCGWDETIPTAAIETADFSKIKFEPCPLDEQGGSILDDDTQLLSKLIGEGGMWPDPITDISYWCTSSDFGFQTL